MNKLINMNLMTIFTFILYFNSTSMAQIPLSQALSTEDKLSTSQMMLPFTKTLREINTKTIYAVHGLASKYVPRIQSFYTKNHKAPADWPFINGISYPGLWTAFNANSDVIQTIDGPLENNCDMNSEFYRTNLRFKLDIDKKILLLDENIAPQTKAVTAHSYDFNDDYKAELSKLKIKSVGNEDQWNKWLHNRKQLIRLAAEAGYYGLYMVSTNEFIILDTQLIQSISIYDCNTLTWKGLDE